MNAVRIAGLLVVLTQGAPVDVCAQQLPVVPGVRVRVTASEGRLVGTIRELGTNGLMLEVQDRASPVELAYASVSKLEISLGKNSRMLSSLKEAAVGLLVGVFVGTLIDATEDDNLQIINFATFFGALGVVIGGVGGAVAPGEHWEEVAAPFDRFGLSILPRLHGRFSVTVSQHF